MVWPVEVVVVDVLVEVATQAGEADVEVAGEGGSPAFFEDQSVQCFDGAVGLGAAGADPGVPDTELVERVAEVAGAELAAVVRSAFARAASPLARVRRRRGGRASRSERRSGCRAGS